MTTIINNIFVILSPIVIMVSLAGEAKSATIAFIETTDSSAFQPNVISVGVVGEGLNTIQGSLNFTSDFPSSDGHDGYAFTVPIHLMITDVRIITGSNTTRRINNIIISSDGTTTPEWFDTPAASEIGSVDGNQNVAFVLNGGQLSAGTYFIGSRGGGWSISGIATYSYQIVAAPIPEPSSAALLLGGFGFAAVSLRKRKK